MSNLTFYRCAECGRILASIKDTDGQLTCCGQAMVKLKACEVDASKEKHVPVVTRDDENRVRVTVGSTEHPMTPEHYIEFIALETARGYRIAYLNPGDKPSALFYPMEPVTAVYAYCNLHGLWKQEA